MEAVNFLNEVWNERQKLALGFKLTRMYVQLYG